MPNRRACFGYEIGICMHINAPPIPRCVVQLQMLTTYRKAGEFRDAKTWHKFTIRDSYSRLVRASHHRRLNECYCVNKKSGIMQTYDVVV